MVRDHRHIHTGIHGKPHGLFPAAGDPVTAVQVFDILPVGQDHAGEAQLPLEQVRDEVAVGMNGQAIDLPRVEHDGHRPGFYPGGKWREVVLPQFVFRDPCRGAVLSAEGLGISEEMLQAGSDPVFVGEIVGGSFQAPDQVLPEDGSQVGVFSECFPLSRPSRIHPQVEDGGEGPCHTGRPGLISGNLPGNFRQGGVPCGGQPDLLGKESGSIHIGGPVYHVEAVEYGDVQAASGKGRLLNPGDHPVPFMDIPCPVVGGVQDRSNLVGDECPVELFLVQHNRFVAA